MPDVFVGSLKSPEDTEIIFNCLKNVVRQTKDIYILANSYDLTESMNFLSDKFKKYVFLTEQRKIK